MVSFSKDEKDLKIPASLGNFQSNGGGGGVTPQEVQEMINSSITQYDETVQGYIGDVEVDVEQNKDDIETLSGLTSELGEAVVSLSGQTAQISGITAQIEAVSAQTGNNTQSIESLSGVTSGISANVESLSGATEQNAQNIETLSGVTSGISAAIETISAKTEGIKQDVYLNELSQQELVGIYNTINGYTDFKDCLKYYNFYYEKQDGNFSNKFYIPLNNIGKKGSQSIYVFEGEYSTLDGGARGTHMFLFELELKNDGTLTFNSDRYCETLDVRANGNNLQLDFDNNYYFGYFNRIADGNSPVSLHLNNSGITVPAVVSKENDEPYIYIDFSVSGKSYEAKWKLAKNETPIYYREKETPGGEQNYVIVDALSAVTNPVDGMLVYKKDRTYVQTIEYYKIQRKPDQGTDGDNCDVKIDGNTVDGTRVYQSGSQFYWDWSNDGRLNERTTSYNGDSYTFLYKTYNDNDTPSNSYFLFEKSLGGLAALGAEISLFDDGAYSTVVDYSETGYTTEYGGFYQYINSAWTQLNIQKDFIFDEMTDSERATLYSTISNMTASDVNKVFAFFLFEEIDGNRDEYQVQFIGFYENQARFGTVVPKLTNEGSNIKMPYVNIDADGTMHKEAGEIRQYNTTKLSIRRDAEYLGFDAGSYSGYTFDFTNVADYTENVIDWENSNNEWILKVQKWDNGLKNGDWSDYTDDNKFHFVNRSLSGVEYLYYYKRTGMTLTVLFVSNPPSSVGDLNINQDVTYSAEAATAVNYYWTNREDFNEFFTGNTASDVYQFEVTSISQFADGSGDDNQVPKLALRIRKNDGNLYSAYGNPVIKYEMLAQNVVLYDKDNEPRNFNMKFYFYYGEYTVSLLAGNDNEYRYAQLTITDNS